MSTTGLQGMPSYGVMPTPEQAKILAEIAEHLKRAWVLSIQFSGDQALIGALGETTWILAERRSRGWPGDPGFLVAATKGEG